MKLPIRIRYLLPAVGFITAILFGLLAYPVIEPDFHSSISTDGHDRLGLGIHHHGTISFYPSEEKSVMRGPVYPVIVATAVSIGGEENLRWTILFLQALMHGLTVLFGSLIAAELAGRGSRHRDRSSLLAGLIIAFHPFPLWYVTRVVVEPVSILLCTATMFLLLRFARRGRLHEGLFLGIVTGIAILTKSTYLLFLPLIPLLLLLSRRRVGVPPIGRVLICTLILPTLILIPWTLRNGALTGSFIPVHILDGVNFAVGDFFVDALPNSPLGYGPIVDRFDYPGLPEGLAGMMVMAPEESVEYDRALRERSLRKYATDPLFLVRKVAVQSITFWTVGSRPVVTIFVGGMQLILLGITLLAAVKLIGRGDVPQLLPLCLLLAYWLAHTPLYAIGRFSVVLVPVMVAYGVWWWSVRSDNEEETSVDHV